MAENSPQDRPILNQGDSMSKSVRAVIDVNGKVHLLEDVRLPDWRRAVVTILDEAPSLMELPTISPTVSPEIRHEDQGSAQWTRFYRLISPLGEGGMGETFLAMDIETEKLVCIKQLHPTIDKRSLVQECRALAKLKHDNIVRLVNFEVANNMPYMVTEFVPGNTLAEVLTKSGRVEQSVVVHIARQVFDALAYAHSQDVFHRDLKPGNIILTGPATKLVAKIVDFGLAIVDRRDQFDIRTGVGRIAGTPSYMAPEQLRGAELTGACDVYATGQIMWEMLSGKRAFAINAVIAAREKATGFAGLEVPAELGVASAIVEVIRDCTKLKPEKRPSARLVLSRLLAIQAQMPI